MSTTKNEPNSNSRLQKHKILVVPTPVQIQLLGGQVIESHQRRMKSYERQDAIRKSKNTSADTKKCFKFTEEHKHLTTDEPSCTEENLAYCCTPKYSQSSSTACSGHKKRIRSARGNDSRKEQRNFSD